ncbi:hypothetical protein ACU4GD_44955 [Cupriavidus basilensis]
MSAAPPHRNPTHWKSWLDDPDSLDKYAVLAVPLPRPAQPFPPRRRHLPATPRRASRRRSAGGRAPGLIVPLLVGPQARIRQVADANGAGPGRRRADRRAIAPRRRRRARACRAEYAPARRSCR